MIKVTFLPDNKSIETNKGASLWETLLRADLRLNSICGGKGLCGRCKVLMKDGVSPATDTEKDLLSAEEIEKGFRLACQTELREDCTIEIPSEYRLKLQKKGSFNLKGKGNEVLQQDFKLDANIEKIYLVLPAPALTDQRSDWERITDNLVGKAGKNIACLKIPLPLLAKIPALVRAADFKITIVMAGNEVIALEEGDTTQNIYGLAIDLGTTTVASYLVDLKNGKEIASIARTNSQITYGDNIISRIEFVQSEKNGLAKLQKEIVDTINELIKENIQNAGIEQEDIYEIVIVANTCMHHLFLGLSPAHLAAAPYVSVTNEELNLKAKHIPGLLLSPETNIYLLPNISAFIGSDILAGIIFNNMEFTNETSLLLDLGTNGELVLSIAGRLWACSTAAGPAFEGVSINSGMRAVEGAIDRVELDGKTIKWHTIGGSAPGGICGSGIIDLVSELLKIGLINQSGRLVSQKECPPGIGEEIKSRLSNGARENKFLLIKNGEAAKGKEIYLTQGDIRAVQTAKAALFAGTKVLLKEAGIEIKDIQTIFLAGAFGNFINSESAVRIGLIPALPLNRIKSVGNAAGKGAESALCSRKVRKISNKIAKEVKYLELSSHPDFSEEFIKAITF